MKKITFLVAMLATALYTSAQSKITFEDQALNGASVVYNGTASVVANPVTTGINTSAYCLDVVNNGYAPVKFSNFNIPTGDKSTYSYVKIKFKVAYKAYNGGSDLDYPSVDVFSSATNPVLDATEKLGTTSSAWGTHATDSLVWKNAEFILSGSTLATIPNGILVLKLAKSKCEYLLDDIEMIPSPIYGTNILTINNFESNAVNDALTTINVYGSAVSSTATVVANPVTTTGNNNSLMVSVTNYNQAASFNVTLPTGKVLNNYDRLFFDRYSAATQYANAWIKADNSTIYADASGYPSQGAGATWLTKDYEIPSTISNGNTFALNIGYTSMNSGSFYLDNIKLHLSSTTTPVSDVVSEPLVYTINNDQLTFTKKIDKVAVYSLEGKLVKAATNVAIVDMTGYNTGIYVMKVVNNGQNFVTKFVK